MTKCDGRRACKFVLPRGCGEINLVFCAAKRPTHTLRAFLTGIVHLDPDDSACPAQVHAPISKKANNSRRVAQSAGWRLGEIRALALDFRDLPRCHATRKHRVRIIILNANPRRLGPTRQNAGPSTGLVFSSAGMLLAFERDAWSQVALPASCKGTREFKRFFLE